MVFTTATIPHFRALSIHSKMRTRPAGSEVAVDVVAAAELLDPLLEKNEVTWLRIRGADAEVSDASSDPTAIIGAWKGDGFQLRQEQDSLQERSFCGFH